MAGTAGVGQRPALPSTRDHPRASAVTLLVLALSALTIVLGGGQRALADMAPFPAQEGNSFGPAAPTSIQMSAETVVIQLGVITTTLMDVDHVGPGAVVTADFVMHNPDSQTHSLGVGFPLQVPEKYAQAGAYIKISQLAAFSGGTQIPTQLAAVGSETWAAWQMAFAPGDTRVRITYDLPATVDRCSEEIGYVLHTGAAWAGPIGQADLIVRFPYAAEATFVSPHGIYLGNTTPGYQVEGTDLHWHYDNLEPTPADDLAATFVTPDCWLTVAQARTAVSQRATADNYWHLATAYGDIVSYGHSFYSPLIAQVAAAQFQKALSLNPSSPQINADCAEYLFYQFGGDLLPNETQSQVVQQCLRALHVSTLDDVLNATCGDFLASANVDPEATLLPTDAAALTAAPPALVLEASVTPAPTSTPISSPQPTASPFPVAATTLPPPTVTIAATAVAQVIATSLPTAAATPVSPAASTLPWVPLGAGIVAILVIASGVMVWRRRGS